MGAGITYAVCVMVYQCQTYSVVILQCLFVLLGRRRPIVGRHGPTVGRQSADVGRQSADVGRRRPSKTKRHCRITTGYVWHWQTITHTAYVIPAHHPLWYTFLDYVELLGIHFPCRPTSADPQPTVGREKQKGTVESQLAVSDIGRPSHIKRMWYPHTIRFDIPSKIM